MNEPARKLHSTYAEYLKLERKSETKHEYVNGEIIAMAGGTIEHGRLAANISRELGNALRGRRCAVYSSDVRVRIRATGRATYPNVSVACGHAERDAEDDDALINPVVLVEVLSDSTEKDDRGEKFGHYRRIPSLRHYVLVSQHEPRIDYFTKTESGRWELDDARPGGVVRLEAIGCEISVDAVYADPFASGEVLVGAG
jgi:Uma2 family endonuclease